MGIWTNYGLDRESIDIDPKPHVIGNPSAALSPLPPALKAAHEIKPSSRHKQQASTSVFEPEIRLPKSARTAKP